MTGSISSSGFVLSSIHFDYTLCISDEISDAILATVCSISVYRSSVLIRSCVSSYLYLLAKIVPDIRFINCAESSLNLLFQR